MNNNPLDYSTYSDSYVNSLIVERDRWRGRTLDAERREQNAQEAAKQLRYERDQLHQALERVRDMTCVVGSVRTNTLIMDDIRDTAIAALKGAKDED